MKVKELIEALQKEDPEREVVIYTPLNDEFSPLSDIWTGMYIPESESCGEMRIEKLTDELKEQGYTEEDVYGYIEDEDDDEYYGEEGQLALALSPLN